MLKRAQRGVRTPVTAAKRTSTNPRAGWPRPQQLAQVPKHAAVACQVFLGLSETASHCAPFPPPCMKRGCRLPTAPFPAATVRLTSRWTEKDVLLHALPAAAAQRAAARLHGERDAQPR